jgi:hypothetical protein
MCKNIYYKNKLVMFCACLAVVILGATTLVNASEARHPVPSPQKLKQAKVWVRDIFKDDIAKARTAEQKAALAKKLNNTAADTEDVVNQYVLLDMARTMAIQAGDVDVAMNALNQLQAAYSIPPLIAHATISSLAYKVKTPKHLVDAIYPMVDSAIARDDYRDAAKLLSLAKRASLRGKDKVLYGVISRREKILRAISLAFTRIKTPLSKLAVNPDDHAANETVGSFYCFYKGDWAKGLPMLTKGDAGDEVMRTAASMDLTSPTEPKKQVELGDLWWRVSENQKGKPQANIRKRAAMWYNKAIPSLSGLDKVRVEKRAKSVRDYLKKYNLKLPVLTQLDKRIEGMWKVYLGYHWTFRKGYGIFCCGKPLLCGQAKNGGFCGKVVPMDKQGNKFRVGTTKSPSSGTASRGPFTIMGQNSIRRDSTKKSSILTRITVDKETLAREKALIRSIEGIWHMRKGSIWVFQNGYAFHLVNNKVSEVGPLVMIIKDTLVIMGTKPEKRVEIIGKSVSINGNAITSLNE